MSVDAYKRIRAEIEKNGEPPLEDGSIDVLASYAWVTLNVNPEGRKERRVTLRILLADLRVRVSADKRIGTLEGVFQPVLSRPVSGLLAPVARGEIWLVA